VQARHDLARIVSNEDREPPTVVASGDRRVVAIEAIVQYRNVLERRLVFDSQLHRQICRVLRHYSIT
jgi:hypothetical protein